MLNFMLDFALFVFFVTLWLMNWSSPWWNDSFKDKMTPIKQIMWLASNYDKYVVKLHGKINGYSQYPRVVCYTIQPNIFHSKCWLVSLACPQYSSDWIVRPPLLQSRNSLSWEVQSHIRCIFNQRFYLGKYRVVT